MQAPLGLQEHSTMSNATYYSISKSIVSRRRAADSAVARQGEGNNDAIDLEMELQPIASAISYEARSILPKNCPVVCDAWASSAKDFVNYFAANIALSLPDR